MSRLSKEIVTEMKRRGLVPISEATRVSKIHPTTLRDWASRGYLKGAQHSIFWFVDLKDISSARDRARAAMQTGGEKGRQVAQARANGVHKRQAGASTRPLAAAPVIITRREPEPEEDQEEQELVVGGEDETKEAPVQTEPAPVPETTTTKPAPRSEPFQVEDRGHITPLRAMVHEGLLLALRAEDVQALISKIVQTAVRDVMRQVGLLPPTQE